MLRWKVGEKGHQKSQLVEARRELSMPDGFEIGKKGRLGNEELNYLCLLREKEESISELRRLIAGGYDPNRQIK